MTLLNVKAAFLTLHVLCMVGTFGALFYYQFGLDATARDDEERSRRLGRMTNYLIGVGFVAALIAYYLNMKISGGALPSRYHAVVGVKFFILIGVGGCIGMSTSLIRKGRPDSAGAQRRMAMFLIAVSAYLGIWL